MTDDFFPFFVGNSRTTSTFYISGKGIRLFFIITPRHFLYKGPKGKFY